MKRMILESLLFIGIVILFYSNAHEVLSPPLQLVALKILLVSAGIIHAHIARKIIFPKVDLETMDLQGQHYASIAFYIIIPLSYTFGG